MSLGVGSAGRSPRSRGRQEGVRDVSGAVLRTREGGPRRFGRGMKDRRVAAVAFVFLSLAHCGPCTRIFSLPLTLRFSYADIFPSLTHYISHTRIFSLSLTIFLTFLPRRCSLSLIHYNYRTWIFFSRIHCGPHMLIFSLSRTHCSPHYTDFLSLLPIAVPVCVSFPSRCRYLLSRCFSLHILFKDLFIYFFYVII